MRTEEALFNMSMNNSETISNLHSQLDKKKAKLIYYEKKVDILKNRVTDLEAGGILDKELINTLQIQNKQKEMENE